MQTKYLEEIKWGIIGAGDVCEIKSAPAMNIIKGSRLVAVMRRNAEKAKDYAERHGISKWYDDADQLINDPDVNAIYIATPPGSHEMYTLRAAKAGKPVYVEKPMARSYRECLSMIEACKKANVPLFTAYYRRMLPNFHKIKDLLQNKVIGDIRYISIILNSSPRADVAKVSKNDDNWRIIPGISGGGYFYDLACHQLDILDFLFGPIHDVHGFAGNQAGLYSAEDIVVGSFQFENGLMGQGSWCFTTSEVSDKEEINIIGSRGQIVCSCFGDHSFTLELEGKEKQLMTFDIPKHIQQPLIQTIVDELSGTGKCPSTGVSGARTNRVMELLCGKHF